MRTNGQLIIARYLRNIFVKLYIADNFSMVSGSFIPSTYDCLFIATYFPICFFYIAACVLIPRLALSTQHFDENIREEQNCISSAKNLLTITLCSLIASQVFALV